MSLVSLSEGKKWSAKYRGISLPGILKYWAWSLLRYSCGKGACWAESTSRVPGGTPVTPTGSSWGQWSHLTITRDRNKP